MNNTIDARFTRMIARTIMLIAVLLCGLSTVQAQTTQFTYQGRLTDGGSLANGSYDLQVKLFDALTGGNQIGTMNPFNGVAVTGGVFTVTLDFGAAAFSGANRWAEISARPTGNGQFTTLTPRQPVTSTPYAIKSLGAASADALSSTCAGCVTDAHVTAIAGSKVTGKIPVAALPAGSNDYIQNTATQQPNSSFNISENGAIGADLTVNGKLVVDATNTFNGDLVASLGSLRFGAGNTGEGIGSKRTPSGNQNGLDFFTNHTSRLSITGSGNIGIGTTSPPTTRFQMNGGKMSILSTDGGYGQLQIGNPNNDEATVTLNTGLKTFGNPPDAVNSWGIGAGAFGIGGGKLAIGYGTHSAPSTPVDNFGAKLTIQNDGNVGIGTTSPGFTLHLAKDVTYPGNVPDGSAQLSVSGSTSPSKRLNIGYDTSTARGFGFIAAGNLGDAWTYLALQPTGGNVGIGTGTATPAEKLHVIGNGLITGTISAAQYNIGSDRILSNPGQDNLFIGVGAGEANRTTDPFDNGYSNVFIGTNAGVENIFGRANTFVGHRAGGGGFGLSNTVGTQNTYIGSDTAGLPNSSNATAIGASARAYCSFCVVLGTSSTNVGIGVPDPKDTLDVYGDIRIGKGTTGCIKDADGTVIAGTCSSDIRFKKEITPFTNVLDKLVRLQPVSFNWRASEFPNKHFGKGLSFGLIAQDVEQVLPELVTKDEQGFRAVNYSKLPLLTIQAIKELRAENEALKRQNALLETRLEAIEQMMQPLASQQVKEVPPKQQ